MTSAEASAGSRRREPGGRAGGVDAGARSDDLAAVRADDRGVAEEVSFTGRGASTAGSPGRKQSGRNRWLAACGIALQRLGRRLAKLAGAPGSVGECVRLNPEVRWQQASHPDLFEQNPNCMWVYEIGTLRNLAVNDAALAHYGYSRDEFLRMTLLDLHPQELHDTLVSNVRNIPGRLRRVGVWPQRRRDGSLIEAEITTHDLEFDGRAARLVLANDVTERRRAERALRESEHRLSEALQLAQLGYWDRNLITEELIWSDELFAMFGVPKEQFGRKLEHFLATLHADDRERVHTTIREAVATRRGFEHTYRIVVNGDLRMIREIGKVECDASGRAVRLFGSAQDITAAWLGEQAVRESEARFRNLADHAAAMIWMTDAQRACTYVNRQWVQVTGQSADAALGDGWLTPVHAEDRAAAQRVLAAANERREPFRMEYRLRRHDGAWLWVIDAGTPRFGPDGAFLGYVGSVFDISERKWAEEAIAQSEERFRLVAETTNDAVWDYDVRRRQVWWSEGFYKLIGHAPDELKASQEAWLERIHPDDRDRVFAGVLASMTGAGERWRDEYRLRRSDGAYLDVLDRGYILRDPQGIPVRAIGGIVDVSARKRADEAIHRLNTELEQRVEQRTVELRETNKELEAFSYTVSHDLRAPLRAIDGFARIIQEDHLESLPAPVQEHLDSIRRNAVQMGQLIDDLLSLSRLGRHAIRMEPIDMTSLARTCYEALASEREGRAVEFVASDLPPCRGDRLLLRLVWQNLLSNAIKYTRARERARIEVFAEQTPETDTAAYVVRDNGVGFDMRYADKLFGVFQRLHSAHEYEGSGVGLAIVQQIVVRHGGRVWAESELGRGTTMRFILSAANAETETAAAEPPG